MQVEEIERQFAAARENAAQRVEVEYHESVNREGMLQKAVSETKAEFDRLNARSFEYQSLKREAEADKSLYEELVRKIKEAGINAGFQNSSIRIADPARPAIKPVFPNMKLNLLLAFLFSTLLAVGIAVLSDVLDGSDPRPRADCHALPDRRAGQPADGEDLAPPAGAAQCSERAGSTAMVRKNADSDDQRADITSPASKKPCARCATRFCLGSFDRRLNSLMITSATPSEGKTTTAVHLAIAHAQQKHKTLLIDCDLRRPGVSTKLNIEVQSGLAGRAAEWHAMAREAGETRAPARSGYSAVADTPAAAPPT